MTGRQIAMTRTTEEFRKRFYLPGYTEFLVTTVKNCFFCPQLNNASGKHQNSATFVVTVVSERHVAIRYRWTTDVKCV